MNINPDKIEFKPRFALMEYAVVGIAVYIKTPSGEKGNNECYFWEYVYERTCEQVTVADAMEMSYEMRLT